MLRVSGPLVAALVVALGLTACTTTSPIPSPTPAAPHRAAKTGDGILRIGTLFPVTGDLSFLGPAQAAGVAAAVQEINAAGGFEGKPVQVVNEDSGSTTPAAAMAALVAAKADVVIGPSSSSLVQSILPAAAAAHLAVITPAATFPGLTTPADAAYLFRTIPAYATQAYALAKAIPAASRKRVAVIYADDIVGTSLARSLPTALRQQKGAIVASVPVASTDAASTVVAKAVAAKPAVVVLATEGGATPQTIALIQALTAAKLGGPALWLTSQNLADYSQALPAGTLTGVNGVLEGAAPDPAFLAKLARANGSLGSTLYAAESYDATILAALAAASAGDDGGAAIASHLRSTSIDGITCASWAECTTVLKTDSNIDYGGASGPVDLAANGDLSSAYYGIYQYAAGNTYTRTSTLLVG